MRTFVVIAAVALVLGVCAYFLLNRSEPLPGPAVPTVAVPEPGDDVIKLILDQKASYEERVRAIKRLPPILSGKQVSTLRELVKTKGVHATIRNDVLTAIDAQPTKPVGIAKDLIDMFHDTKEDVTWRDYCLQHIERVYEFSSEKEQIKATLVEAANITDKKTHFSGTALLALERLAKTHPELAPALTELARKQVESRTEDPERAVVALQVSRGAGDKTVLSEARKIAADEKALVRLRMSAIGTLGELGEPSDLELLKQLAQDKDSRVKNAAQASLTNLGKSSGAVK